MFFFIGHKVFLSVPGSAERRMLLDLVLRPPYDLFFNFSVMHNVNNIKNVHICLFLMLNVRKCI